MSTKHGPVKPRFKDGAHVAVRSGVGSGQSGVWLGDHRRPGWGDVMVWTEGQSWVQIRVTPGDRVVPYRCAGCGTSEHGKPEDCPDRPEQHDSGWPDGDYVEGYED